MPEILAIDAVYRDWISTLPCSIPGCNIKGAHPHHLKHRSQGGLDPDNLLPLCWMHHRHCHDYQFGTTFSWLVKQGIPDPWAVAENLSRIYRGIHPDGGHGCPFIQEGVQ